MQTDTVTTSTYEQHLAERRETAQRRFQLALDAANCLAGYLTGGGSTLWRVDRKASGISGDHDVLTVTNGHGAIRVLPGGYKRSHRLVAYVDTYRQVQFGPDDWDTVRVTHDVATEATVNEDKPALQVAKEFARKLGSVALNVADKLEEEQARVLADRNKGQAVLNEFVLAGWSIAGSSYSDTTYVYVPVTHALYRLGISALTVDRKTGRIDYQSRAYPAHDITVKELVNVKL